jgi:hypothetical protein
MNFDELFKRLKFNAIKKDKKKSINSKNRARVSLNTVINATRDWVRFVCTEHNFEHSQNINRVLLIRTSISVLEQKVAQWHFEHDQTNGKKYNKPQIPNLSR